MIGCRARVCINKLFAVRLVCNDDPSPALIRGAAKQSPGSINATTQTARDGAQTAVFMGSGLRFAALERQRLSLIQYERMLL